MNISNSIYDFDLIKKCTVQTYGIPFIYIFTNFLCIDCPAKYKNFGQTQQQVTRSLCNLGKRGYRINYMHTVGLFILG